MSYGVSLKSNLKAIGCFYDIHVIIALWAYLARLAIIAYGRVHNRIRVLTAFLP